MTTIRGKLIVWVVFPLLLVYALIAFIQTRSEARWALRITGASLQETTTLNAAQCDAIFASASEIAIGIANYMMVQRPKTEAEITDYVRQCLLTHPEIVGSAVAFEPDVFAEGVKRYSPFLFRKSTGAELQYKDLAREYDYENWEWYEKPKTLEKASWSKAYFDEGGGDMLMCTFSVPFFREERFAGVVTIDISLDRIREIVSQVTPMGAVYRLFGNNGILISSPNHEEEMKVNYFDFAKAAHNSSLDLMIQEMLAGNSGTITYQSVETGLSTCYVYAPLKTTGWTLLASIPERQVLGPVYSRLAVTVTIFCLGMVLIGLIILYESFRITRPIGNLTRFAEKLAAGELDVQVQGIHSNDEIGRLARTFDQMVIDLKSNIDRRISEETARKTVEGELMVARRIQASLLPHIFPPFPDQTEFELHAFNEPATYMAGDFYDFFFVDKETLALVMADVSGKGVPAAMFMAVSRTAIRNFTVPGKSPQTIISALNEVLYRDNEDTMFVTLFYGHYNINTGSLTYVNAGHNPPYLVRKTGTLEALDATGPIAAVFDDVVFEQKTVQLDFGDLFVAFTDGVTEAHKAEDVVLYGEKRFENLLREVGSEPVDRLCGMILEDVLRYSEGERFDDITLLALRNRS